MHLSLPFYVLAFLLCQPLITSLPPPPPLFLIPLSCRDSHTVSARWSYQDYLKQQATFCVCGCVWKYLPAATHLQRCCVFAAFSRWTVQL